METTKRGKILLFITEQLDLCMSTEQKELFETLLNIKKSEYLKKKKDFKRLYSFRYLYFFLLLEGQGKKNARIGLIWIWLWYKPLNFTHSLVNQGTLTQAKMPESHPILSWRHQGEESLLCFACGCYHLDSQVSIFKLNSSCWNIWLPISVMSFSKLKWLPIPGKAL